MWTTFLSDLLVASIGACMTVAIAYVTYLVKVANEERWALQALIDDAHHRRALAPTHGGRVPGAAGTDDFSRCNRSIVSLRNEVQAARRRVRPKGTLQTPLSKVARACNRYLEASAADPDSYVIYLGRLREEISAAFEGLTRARRRLNYREPGHGAF